MKRLFALFLALVLLLCACGSNPAGTSAPTTVPTTTEPATVPAESTLPPAESTETTEPIETTQPLPAGINPLTGEALQEVSNSRPTAIMINNLSKAVPQCGISKADLLYEIIAEGSITRFMAIFRDLSDVGVLGPVRSVRPYFVRVAQHYGAIISSAGGSEEAYDLIDELNLDYLNGIGNAGGWFYRDAWRRANRGYEHSLMTTGENLMAAAKKKNMTTEMEDADYGFHFTEEMMTVGESASEITIWFYKNGKKTVMKYDEAAGLYSMSQHGKASVDGNDDSPVCFRNVVVLESDSRVLDNVGHMQFQMTGTGDGWYARDGKIIPIKWSRENNQSHYVYTDLEGNPISFGVGKSYIAIVPDGSPFSCQ